MRLYCYAVIGLLLLSGAAAAQDEQRVPTPDELAFASLPRDVQHISQIRMDLTPATIASVMCTPQTPTKPETISPAARRH